MTSRFFSISLSMLLAITFSFALQNQHLAVAGTAPAAQNTDDAASAKNSELQSLQSEKATNESRLKTQQDQLKAQQDAKLEAERELTRAREAGNTAVIQSAEAKVKAAEEGIKQRQENIKTIQGELNEVSKKIDKHPETIMSRVQKQYDDLIDDNSRQGKAIQDAIKVCNDCPEKDILELRAEANFEYNTFLLEKQALEICKVDPDCKDDKDRIKQLEASATEASNTVKNVLSKITEIERTAEKGRTFEVSNIFNVSGEKKEPIKFLTFTNQIATWMLTLVASLAVTTMIVGGFLMIISGGDESRLETGKTIFTYSLIGIIVTLMAYGIVAFIQSIFY